MLITHNPHHAYPVGDRFLLLKRGRSLGSREKQDITLDHLTHQMAGAELETLTRELESDCPLANPTPTRYPTKHLLVPDFH